MTPVLQIENLTKSFGSLILLSEISFSISENQRVGLIARNGTGKSTLLKIVAGLDTPDSGNVVRRNDITAGYLDQNPFLDPELSILDNVFKGDSEAIKAINRYEQALISCDKMSCKLPPNLWMPQTHGIWKPRRNRFLCNSTLPILNKRLIFFEVNKTGCFGIHFNKRTRFLNLRRTNKPLRPEHG